MSMSFAIAMPRTSYERPHFRTTRTQPSYEHSWDVKWAKQVAYTEVLTFEADRMLTRVDQDRVSTVLAKFREQPDETLAHMYIPSRPDSELQPGLVTVVYSGSTIQYAVNLRHVTKGHRKEFLAMITQAITDALALEMLEVDTALPMTSYLRQEIKSTLERWHSHVIREISFHGEVVHIAITLKDIAKEYHDVIRTAIKGDILVASRQHDWI